MYMDKFHTHQQAAHSAQAAGDYPLARQEYLHAAKCLISAASKAQGAARTVLLERANKLVAVSDALPAQAATPAMAAGVQAAGIKFAPAQIPDIGFDDVAGLEDVKKEIRNRVIYAMQHPEVYERFKKETGGGVLLYGPPGTGKTMIARAIAHEVEAKFYPIKCSDIVSKWVGDTEANIKELFETARAQKVAVIFFDEFEAVSPKRSTSSTVMPRAVAELLAQIDGFSKSENTLLLLAATNRPWDIDSGILRSGRFGKKLYIPLPDLDARRYILQMRWDGIPMEPGIDPGDIAAKTEGFSGADMSELADRCSDPALERSIENIKNSGDCGQEVVSAEDIYATLDNFRTSVDPADIKRLEKFMRDMG